MGICERKKQRNAVRVVPSKVGMVKVRGKTEMILLVLMIYHHQERHPSAIRGHQAGGHSIDIAWNYGMVLGPLFLAGEIENWFLPCSK